MWIAPLLAVLWVAVMPAVSPNKKPPMSNAQRKELAGVLATLDAAELRLFREFALGQPEFERHVSDALAIIQEFTDPSAMGSSCPSGSCAVPGGCVACEPPYGTLATASYRIGAMKTNLLVGADGPGFLQHEEQVLQGMRRLSRVFREPLSAQGFCDHGGNLMPCR
jgi:hypothetical protein